MDTEKEVSVETDKITTLGTFEADNADGLRGQIMMHMCKDMLGLQNNVTDESLSPQEWYKQLSIISKIKLPDVKPENPIRHGNFINYYN